MKLVVIVDGRYSDRFRGESSPESLEVRCERPHLNMVRLKMAEVHRYFTRVGLTAFIAMNHGREPFCMVCGPHQGTGFVPSVVSTGRCSNTCCLGLKREMTPDLDCLVSRVSCLVLTWLGRIALHMQ